MNGISYFNTWMPSVIEESANGSRDISILTKQLTDRTLYLTGKVDDDMANKFVASMTYLVKESKEPINIVLNSHGGEVQAGLCIYDMIQACGNKVPVNIYCTSMAASMGAVILAAGQKGRRFVQAHSKVMIHEPLIAGGMGGSATSISKTAESILETKALLNGILAKHTGKSIEEINEATAFDNFMTAEQAIEFGLCDEVRTII